MDANVAATKSARKTVALPPAALLQAVPSLLNRLRYLRLPEFRIGRDPFPCWPAPVRAHSEHLGSMTGNCLRIRFLACLGGYHNKPHLVSRFKHGALESGASVSYCNDEESPSPNTPWLSRAQILTIIREDAHRFQSKACFLLRILLERGYERSWSFP